MLLQRLRKLSGGNLAAILKTAFGLVLMVNLVYPNISSTTMLNRCTLGPSIKRGDGKIMAMDEFA